jgi:hypothetical protein
MFARCKCCVLSGRGLCDELITSPEESNDCDTSLCVNYKFVNEEVLAHWEAVAPETK